MIKLASPDIRESDILKAVEVLRSGNLVQGRYVSEFEEKLSEFTKIKNCAVVSSGTAALHLTLIALGIKPGDHVVVPAFTFPATANVVENIGAHVVLCDVDPKSYVVTPDEIEKTIALHADKPIKAIIVVHEFGYPARIMEIAEIAKRYDVKLIEDAACALGTIADGHHVGHYSDAACFSFHPRKAITTGEGGAVVSSSVEITERIKQLRNHGIAQESNGRIDFIAAGLNYRMTDFQAALAIGQLERFPDELSRRKELAGLYWKELSILGYFLLPHFVEGHSWQSFMVVMYSIASRDRIIKKMLDSGVQTNYGAYALNGLSYYKNKYGMRENDFPISLMLYQQGLVLPLYGKLSTEDAVMIPKVLKSLVH